MNENDLRDCFAMFALAGLTMREGVGAAMEHDAWALADKMMAIRETSKEPEQEIGIVAIKSRRKKSD